MPQVSQNKNAEAAQRQVANRWTPKLASLGWTPISDYFLANYYRLKITPLEAMVIVHLMSFKWDDSAPFPAIRTVAKRMGVTSTSVRTHLRKLGKKEFIIREVTVGSTNRFHLQPLFRALEELASEDRQAAKKKSGIVDVELVSNKGGLGKIVGQIAFTIDAEGFKTKSTPRVFLTRKGRARVCSKLTHGQVVGEEEGYLWRVTS